MTAILPATTADLAALNRANADQPDPTRAAPPPPPMSAEELKAAIHATFDRGLNIGQRALCEAMRPDLAALGQAVDRAADMCLRKVGAKRERIAWLRVHGLFVAFLKCFVKGIDELDRRLGRAGPAQAPGADGAETPGA
jgi:hypothetical protein